MVAARDLDGESVVAAGEPPCGWMPRPAGPITHVRPAWPRANDRVAAITAGLSDRLGWEAVLEFDRGRELGRRPADRRLERLVVLDGRVGHEVPTVVTLGDDIVRWGAGATWSQALERAVFGHDAVGRERRRALAAGGGSAPPRAGGRHRRPGDARAARAGVFRTSVQLMVATPWDGGGTRCPVNVRTWRRR